MNDGNEKFIAFSIFNQKIMTHDEVDFVIGQLRIHKKKFSKKYIEVENQKVDRAEEEYSNRIFPIKEIKPKNMGPGFIYLGHSNGLYKIGIAGSLKKRLASHRTSNPHFEYIHSIHVNDSLGCEAILHNRYSHLRKSGEWFKLSEKEVNEIKNFFEDAS